LCCGVDFVFDFGFVEQGGVVDDDGDWLFFLYDWGDGVVGFWGI